MWCLVAVFVCVHASTAHATQLSSNQQNQNDTLHTGSHPLHYRGRVQGSSDVETLSWAVKITPTSGGGAYSAAHLNALASRIASQVGLVNEGQIGVFREHYLLSHPLHRQIVRQYHNYNQGDVVHLDNQIDNRTTVDESLDLLLLPAQNKFFRWLRDQHRFSHLDWLQVVNKTHSDFDGHVHIEWHQQQIVRSRQKRKVRISDPAFKRQWHLVNRINWGYDINVTGVWDLGITGQGVTVVVVDDGLAWNNPDLLDNYSADGSYDLNDKDADPTPNTKLPKNHHGTRCAGEIAAVKNSVCGVGVAYEARIAGLRVLDGPMTDEMEADAFTKNLHVNDVFSCSWGPDDDGKTVDGPHYLATKGLRHGVDYGRNGYGAIYVVASGNGGRYGDNCNFDGYANSVYTLTIGAIDEWNQMPYYAEECASMLAVTYSSGDAYKRRIVTTDWTYQGGTGCTDDHTGTSAAAPIAAGIIALMLQARPCLTWRDVQYIIIMAAVKVDVDIAHWHRNAAGLHHSHKHGFGLMNAWRLVNAAKIWESVPWPTTFTSTTQYVDQPIKVEPKTLRLTYSVNATTLQGYDLFTLEHIQVSVTISHVRRGDLEIRLRCPSLTESIMAAPRPNDDSKDGFIDWAFSTVRCWGEKPEGIYTLIITDVGNVPAPRGHLTSWILKLYGTPMTFKHIQERIRKVNDAGSSGRPLQKNITLPCAPPPARPPPYVPLSERILKVLLLSGAFCIFLAVYETFEYIFCYDDEKRMHKRLLEMSQSARELVSGSSDNNDLASSNDASESSRLLGNNSEDIPMEIISSHDTDENTLYQQPVVSDTVNVEERQSLVEGEQCSRIAQLFAEGLTNETPQNDEDETDDL